MSKSLASLMGGEISMRERALKATQHNHYSVLQNRLVEENYGVKITELAGKSFRPLVGFTVTFDEILPFAQARQRKVDDVASFDYVEFGTGYRMQAYLSVELDEDYLPLGVELKAFRDAVVVQTEQLINACGYTFNETPIMGLRNVNSVSHSQDPRFVEMFNGDKSLKKIVDHQLNDKTALSFEETENDFRFSTPANVIHHTSKGGKEGLLVHVDLLGDLAELNARRIFIESNSEKDEHGKSTITYTYGIDVAPTGKYVDRHIDFHKLENVTLGSLALETIVEGKNVTQCQPKDWKSRAVNYDIVVNCPDDWRFVTIRRPHGNWLTEAEMNGELSLTLLAELNLRLPALLRGPRRDQEQEAEDVQLPRRTFRRWVADGFRAFADWFENN